MSKQKPGPKPRPKGTVVARVSAVYSIGEIYTFDTQGLTIEYQRNEHATKDQIRKACKKALEEYFKQSTS